MSKGKPIDLAAVRRLREERRAWLKQHPNMTTPEALERIADCLEGDDLEDQEIDDDGIKEEKDD